MATCLPCFCFPCGGVFFTSEDLVALIHRWREGLALSWHGRIQPQRHLCRRLPYMSYVSTCMSGNASDNTPQLTPAAELPLVQRTMPSAL